MIGGTIKDFKDGDTKLGFKVDLGMTGIGNGTIDSADAENATATFGDDTNDADATGEMVGTWSAQTYGPSADETDLLEVKTVHSQLALLESLKSVPIITRLSAHSRQRRNN